MGGYDPRAYGGRGPVSGPVAGMNYLTSLLSGLKQGFHQKRDNTEMKFGERVKIIEAQRAEARARIEAGDTSPEAVQAAANADKAYADMLKEAEKLYQPDKTIWGALKNRISGGKKADAGGPQPAPVPKAQGAPAAARPPEASPNPYGAMEASRAKATATVRDINELKASVEKGTLEDDAKQRDVIKTSQQTYIDTIQKMKTGAISPGEAAQTITLAMNQAFPKERPGEKEAISALSMGLANTKDPQKRAEYQQAIIDIAQGIKLEAGKALTGPVKYPTGKVAESIQRAGLPIKPLSEYTTEEWNLADSVSQKEHKEVMRKAAATAGAHDHRYQQFQARTAGDTQLIGRLETRIGQLQSLTASDMNRLSDDEKKANKEEVSATRSQIIELRQKDISAYDEIYGAAPRLVATPPAAATPAPPPTAGVSPAEAQADQF